MSGKQGVLAGALALLLLGGLACSPEATRTRSGGPGADIGNRIRNKMVELHGGRASDGMYYETPRVGEGVRTQR